jgi:hypothetical protein
MLAPSCRSPNTNVQDQVLLEAFICLHIRSKPVHFSHYTCTKTIEEHNTSLKIDIDIIIPIDHTANDLYFASSD